MKQLLLLLFNFTFVLGFASAQESDCSVSMISIIGTYTGDCLRGKANGIGKAVGTDSYEGEFKNGYPDGVGTYTWRSGQFYKGSFKKGEMTGMGEMHLITNSGQDSIVAGFWKNGKYIREFEVPYKIHSAYRGTNVGNARVKAFKKGASTGTIALEVFSGSVLEVKVAEGLYESATASTGRGNSNKFTVHGVSFPFRATFIMNNGEIFEATFYEVADYNVTVMIFSNF